VWTGRPAIPIFAGGEQAGRFTTALLEVRFLLQNGRLLTEKGQNLTFLRIFLHAIIEQLPFIINHLRAK